MFLIFIMFLAYIITSNDYILYAIIGLISYKILKFIAYNLYKLTTLLYTNYKATQMLKADNSKELYLLSWFYIFGHFCKIEGNVLPSMIKELEEILSESSLEERKKAINAFNLGKESNDISLAEKTIFLNDFGSKIYLSFVKVLCKLSFFHRNRTPSSTIQKKILKFIQATSQKNTLTVSEGLILSMYHSATVSNFKTEDVYESFFKAFKEKRKEYNREHKRNYNNYNFRREKNNSLENHFLILGINKESTLEEAKKAYRKLMSQYHPDKIASLNDPELEKEYLEKSQSIQNAYEYLKNNFYKKEQCN